MTCRNGLVPEYNLPLWFGYDVACLDGLTLVDYPNGLVCLQLLTLVMVCLNGLAVKYGLPGMV